MCMTWSTMRRTSISDVLDILSKTNYMVKHYDIRRSYYDEDEIPVEEINFTGIYEAKIDENVIAERKKKAADKAKAKAEKAVSKSKAKVFKNKFFL